MNNVDYVVICANQGVNKCNLLVHPDPGLNLPVQWVDATTDPKQYIKFYTLSNCDSKEIGIANPVSLKFTIVVNSNCELHLYIGSQLITFNKLQIVDLQTYSNQT